MEKRWERVLCQHLKIHVPAAMLCFAGTPRIAALSIVASIQLTAAMLVPTHPSGQLQHSTISWKCTKKVLAGILGEREVDKLRKWYARLLFVAVTLFTIYLFIMLKKGG